jgi:hypothetical protein
MGKPKKNTKNEECFPPSLLLSSERNSIRFETLLPDRIWVLHNFFSQEECQAWIQYMEQDITMELTQQRGNKYYAQRDCYRFQRNDESMARRIYERMQHHCKVLPLGPPIMCNPNLRLYKYTKGMSFGKHVDESQVIPGWGKTRVTVLIYLSECQGGATAFESNVAFSPQEGAMLLHVHGDECLEHEGKPVKGGIKYVLRTDLVYAN